MKGIETLIRLHRNVVDEHRRRIADLRKIEERIQDDQRKLEETLAQEQRVAARGLELSATYAVYANWVITERERLDAALANIRLAIRQAEEQLAEAFQELKRYELALEEQQRRRAEEAKRRETQRFDEVASVRFTRQSGEG